VRLPERPPWHFLLPHLPLVLQLHLPQERQVPQRQAPQALQPQERQVPQHQEQQVPQPQEWQVQVPLLLLQGPQGQRQVPQHRAQQVQQVLVSCSSSSLQCVFSSFQLVQVGVVQQVLLQWQAHLQERQQEHRQEHQQECQVQQVVLHLQRRDRPVQQGHLRLQDQVLHWLPEYWWHLQHQA